MMTSKQRSVLCTSALAAGLASFAGCNTPPDGEAGAGEPGKETVTVDQETQVARATRLDPTHVRVEMFSRAGEKLFQVDLRPTNGDEDTLTWELVPGPASQQTSMPVTSGGMPSPYAELPSLEECAKGAALVQGKIMASINGPAYDSWGCDLPVRGLTSCGPKGTCCDRHDACYARNRCNASSWWKPWPFTSAACKACNAAVVSCFTSVLPIGKSVCCSRGNCGRPR